MIWIYDLVNSMVPYIESQYFWIPVAGIVLVFLVHFVRYLIEGGLNRD